MDIKGNQINVRDQIVSFLNTNQIEYKLTEHEPVRTSEDAAKVRGVPLKTGAKAMVIKAENRFYLMILPADRKISWKQVRLILKVKSIRFATVEEAEELTKVEMGSVPPFGNLLGIETYLDKSLLENEYVNFNPGSKSHSISMKAADLVRITKPHITMITEEIQLNSI